MRKLLSDLILSLASSSAVALRKSVTILLKVSLLCAGFIHNFAILVLGKLLQLMAVFVAGMMIARSALLMAAGISLVVLPLSIMAVAVSNPFVRTELDYMHARSSVADLYDRDGRWLGITPPNLFADWSDGKRLLPDHAATIPSSIPPIWRACLVSLEDRSFDGISKTIGIDPLQILKSGYQTATGQRRRGASTLLMQIVRTLQGRSPDREERVGDVMMRKFAEIAGANALASMIANGDPLFAERYLSMHMPLIIGAQGSGFGPPIHGIAISSHILFGKDVGLLDDAQQAILAAAVKYPILLAPPGDRTGAARATARWDHVKSRAEHCLTAVLDTKPQERDDAFRKMAEMVLPQPSISLELAALLPADTREAWKIIVNPMRRARYFAGRELGELLPALADTINTDWRGRVASVHLTTSAVDNPTFVSSFRETLKSIQIATPGLDRDLLSSDPAKSAQTFAVLTDPTGHIRRYYASEPGFRDRKMGVASTAKLAAASVLGQFDTTDTNYCRAPIPDHLDESTRDRRCPDALRISALRSFATSSSPAIFWALVGRPPVLHVAHETATNLGLAVPGVSAATALATGIAEQTPAEQIRTAAAIARGYTGTAADTGLPRLVSSLTILDEKTGSLVDRPIRETGLVEKQAVAKLFTDRARSFFRYVIGAVTRKGGTLAAVDTFRDHIEGEIFAKTGTLSVSGATHAIHITGFVIRKGEPWPFLISIASSDPRVPLGHQLIAGHFSPLLLPLLGPAEKIDATDPHVYRSVGPQATLHNLSKKHVELTQ